jgi:hypothetical protein
MGKYWVHTEKNAIFHSMHYMLPKVAVDTSHLYD